MVGRLPVCASQYSHVLLRRTCNWVGSLIRSSLRCLITPSRFASSMHPESALARSGLVNLELNRASCELPAEGSRERRRRSRTRPGEGTSSIAIGTVGHLERFNAFQRSHIASRSMHSRAQNTIESLPSPASFAFSPPPFRLSALQRPNEQSGIDAPRWPVPPRSLIAR